jgi:type I restriction enzyme M protein
MLTGDDMLTGELRSKIDAVWNAFWAGGIANPLEVIEQITYLLFMRGLDEPIRARKTTLTRLAGRCANAFFQKARTVSARRAALSLPKCAGRD